MFHVCFYFKQCASFRTSKVPAVTIKQNGSTTAETEFASNSHTVAVQAMETSLNLVKSANIVVERFKVRITNSYKILRF